MAVRTITVAIATVRYGYHAAATVRDCTVTRTERGWSLGGTVVSSDAFRLTQRPLAFLVTHQKGSWIWPVTELQIAGASVTAMLGPMES